MLLYYNDHLITKLKTLLDVERFETVLQNRLGPEPRSPSHKFRILHTLPNWLICSQIRIETNHFFVSSTTCSILQSQSLYCNKTASKGNAPPDKGHQEVYRGLPHNMLIFSVW